ncbi:MAG: dTDP-4-dehydrorhamnose reductase [Patescibacteria group bacterium]|nr:dTDP-4-dehydrorhamnose reductase [Patescibacteria group bacterium]
MEQKILILGASGMLGHDLTKAFSGREVFAWDMSALDITDGTAVERKITTLKPTIVINAAAYTDVDGAEKNEALASKINGEAVGYLAAVCQKIGALLVHYSTEYVFDGQNNDGYDETSLVSPINAYGRSKAKGEALLQQYGEMFYLIRSSWLYGKAPQVGKPRGLNFVETMLKLAQEIKEIDVVSDQFGKPTYAADLAVATRQLVDSAKPCGIYHITNDGACSWYDFAKKIFEIKGIDVKVNPIKTEDYPFKTPRPKFAVLQNTKLEPLRSWEEALKEYLEGVTS